MDIKVFAPHELEVVLRALRDAALENDHFTGAERALVEGVARIHGVEVDADALEPSRSTRWRWSSEIDLSDGYDVFADKNRLLEDVRAELGILPLARAAKAS
jgi:hypothetical protein